MKVALAIKRERLAICAAVLLCALVQRAAADPVYGKVFSLKQPDGSPYQVKIWGDEFYRIVESLDGWRA